MDVDGAGFVLVLDHYHVIGAGEIHKGVAFLLDHLPPRMHLIIASRADPALPLARLRAGGELVELRAADLRFTPDDAAAYLNEGMGLGLGCASWPRELLPTPTTTRVVDAFSAAISGTKRVVAVMSWPRKRAP